MKGSKKVTKYFTNITLVFLMLTALLIQGAFASEIFIKKEIQDKALKSIIAKHGNKEKERAQIGVKQVVALWEEKDGDEQTFIDFCTENFCTDEDMLNRLEDNFNLLNGSIRALDIKMRAPLQIEGEKILPIDKLFENLAIGSHLSEDFRKTKITFSILLNYPQSTLEQRNTEGKQWSRKKWAQTRLSDSFKTEIPAEVYRSFVASNSKTNFYLNTYNIHMNNLITPLGERLFPKKLILLSHWGLRDEIRGQYKEKEGLVKQKLIQKVMERIIAQDIPKEVINNSELDWEPYSNEVSKDGNKTNYSKEAGIRYGHLKSIFLSLKSLDQYNAQETNTAIKRNFNRDLEISEQDVEDLLMSIISSPQIKDCKNLIEKRLGRNVEPFDIWYNGFEAKINVSEKELDRITYEKYPTPEDFQKDLPNILTKLGFDKDRAEFIGGKIIIQPSRSAGHATGMGGREFNTYLRIRTDKGKMNYKALNTTCHELGHGVEQITSTALIDNTLLKGVPNTAFTEAFAFMFQSRDMEILGLAKNDQESELVLDVLWKVYEQGGVSLVTMKTWRWMYEHPDATEQELGEAVIDIAQKLWNQYYEPVMGGKDCTLLAIYSHMIGMGLYMPNYPIGHIIRYQLEDYMKGRNLAQEMTRMCLAGNLTPDLWMENAVGKKISTEPILRDAKILLDKKLGKK